MGVVSGTTAAIIGALAIGGGLGLAGASMMGGKKESAAPQLPQPPAPPKPEDATKKALDEERLRRARMTSTVLTSKDGLTTDGATQKGTLLGS
jgi:hypothetical protein